MADPTVTSNTDRSLYLIFLVIIPLMCGICASFCCLSVSWENYKKQEHYQPSICNNKIGAYLCCFSAQVTKLLIESGIMAKPGLPTENIDGDPSEIEKLNPSPSQRRNTIFQVDVNVQTSKLANSSWGTANDALFTDVITVTPKNSPDLHRKVRLPSDSPLLHHRSQDIEQRPKYGKSFSSDSGCVSDLEEHRGKPDMNMSMSSLVNIVMKYGRGDRSRGSSAEPEIPNPKQFVTQKSVPLSRLVLDPYGPKSNVKTAGNSSLEVQRPGFNRSLSSDAATSQSVTADLPKSGYLTPKKSTSSINTNSSSDSESFYVNIPSEIKKGGNIGRCSPPEDLKVKNQHTVFKASRKAPQIPKIKIEDSDAKITKHKKGSIKPNCADSNPSEQTELKSAAKKPMLPPQSKTSNNNRPLPTTTNIPGVTPGMAMDKISGGSKVSLDQPKARPPIKDTGSRSFREQPSQGSENSNEFLIKFNQVKNKESNTSSATPSVAEQTFSQSAPRRPMLPPTKRS
ncbi:uncharacterized protein LOC108682202 [Hyalella azteca]|nr:uncharacterized protein LOC108682202 [Hyalella azteca]